MFDARLLYELLVLWSAQIDPELRDVVTNILGDADSSSPIDIDAVQGGVPVRVQPNAATPRGDLRPSKQQ